jgi:hypothetical protein
MMNPDAYIPVKEICRSHLCRGPDVYLDGGSLGSSRLAAEAVLGLSGAGAGTFTPTTLSPLTPLERRAAATAYYNALGALDALLQAGGDRAKELAALNDALVLWITLCHCRNVDGTWSVGTIPEGWSRSVGQINATAESDIRVYLTASGFGGGTLRINTLGSLRFEVPDQPAVIITHAGLDFGTGAFAGTGHVAWLFGSLYSSVNIAGNAITGSWSGSACIILPCWSFSGKF